MTWVHTPCIDTCNRALLLGFAITAVAQEQGEATALNWPEHAPQLEFPDPFFFGLNKTRTG